MVIWASFNAIYENSDIKYHRPNVRKYFSHEKVFGDCSVWIFEYNNTCDW